MFVRGVWECVCLLRLRRAKPLWRDYKATTACTVRLLDKMGLKEVEDHNNTDRWVANNGKKRCVYADSWFASVGTAMALKQELGLHFTGPIKRAHKHFPRDEMCWTLSHMRRGAYSVEMQ